MSSDKLAQFIALCRENAGTYLLPGWDGHRVAQMLEAREAEKQAVEHRPGCDALGGYGHGVGACNCGADEAEKQAGPVAIQAAAPAHRAVELLAKVVAALDGKRAANEAGEPGFEFNGALWAVLEPARAAIAAQAPAVAHRLKADDVQWIVNDIAELGVMIHGQAFFLYKGHSLVYEDATHDETGEPMRYRPVFKREFGECAHPINYKDPTRIGTVSLDDSDEWRELPPAHPQVQNTAPPSPLAEQDKVAGQVVYLHRLSKFEGGKWVPATELIAGEPAPEWAELAASKPDLWRVDRRVTGVEIARGIVRAVQASATDAAPPSPLAEQDKEDAELTDAEILDAVYRDRRPFVDPSVKQGAIEHARRVLRAARAKKEQT